jgi:hypothetical protein
MFELTESGPLFAQDFPRCRQHVLRRLKGVGHAFTAIDERYVSLLSSAIFPPMAFSLLSD